MKKLSCKLNFTNFLAFGVKRMVFQSGPPDRVPNSGGDKNEKKNEKTETPQEKLAREMQESVELIKAQSKFLNEKQLATAEVTRGKENQNPAIKARASDAENKINAIDLTENGGVLTKEKITQNQQKIRGILDKYLDETHTVEAIEARRAKEEKRWEGNFNTALGEYLATVGSNEEPTRDELRSLKEDYFDLLKGKLAETASDCIKNYKPGTAPEIAFDKPNFVSGLETIFNDYRNKSRDTIINFLNEPEKLADAVRYVNARTTEMLGKIDKYEHNDPARNVTERDFDELREVYIKPNKAETIDLLGKTTTNPKVNIGEVLHLFDQRMDVATAFLDRFSHSAVPNESRDLVKHFARYKKEYDQRYGGANT